MNRILFSINIILLILVNILFGQELKIKNNFSSIDSSNIRSGDNNITFIEGGINISNFQKINSELRRGYSFGTTFTKSYTNSIGLMFSILVEKEKSYLNKRKGRYNKNDVCYLEYYDMNMSFWFLEFPVAVYYKFWEHESVALYFSLGYGISLSQEDNSKRTNFELTDDVVIPYPCYYYPQGDYYDNYENEANSGWSANAGIFIKYRKLIFKIIYINKRYPIKGYDKLQTFSFNLGYLMP